MRQEKLEVVCSFDPAIDTDAMTQDEMLEYLKTRDRRHLKLKPEPVATVYHVHEAPNALWESYVMRGDTEDERAKRAFQVCVSKVTHLYQRDGSHIPDCSPTGRMGDHTVWTDKEVHARFSPAERLEVGTVAWQHSFLPRRVTTGPGLRLPLSLLDILIHQTFRSADASQSDAAPSSDEPLGSTTSKTAETETASAETGVASASATGAIAMATSP